MTQEIHVAGLLVHTDLAQTADVVELLRRLEATDVHTVGADGKLVVICESGSGREVLDRIEYMRDLPGVANVALVYQHAEPAGAMDEEMSDGHNPTGFH